MNQAQQFCTFFLDGHYFGVEVEKVQEVRHNSEMTRVPLTPSVVEGLLNLRGQIVTAIDLRKRLELSPRAAGVGRPRRKRALGLTPAADLGGMVV